MADAVRRVVGGEAGRAARYVQVDAPSEALPGPQVVGVAALHHLWMQPDHQLDVLPEAAGLVGLEQHVRHLDAVREVALRAGGVEHDPLGAVKAKRAQVFARSVQPVRRKYGSKWGGPVTVICSRLKPWRSMASSTMRSFQTISASGLAPTIVLEVRLSQPCVKVTEGTPAARARRIIRMSLTTTPAVAVTTTSGWSR